jgi:hypothetical protein
MRPASAFTRRVLAFEAMPKCLKRYYERGKLHFILSLAVIFRPASY